MGKISGLGLVAALLWAVPSNVSGQDCGQQCFFCGSPFEELWEGANYSPSGSYNMACPGVVSTTCADCMFSAAEGAVDQEAIGRAVLTAEPYELGTLVAAYGDRLLVADDRDLVAIQGSACSPDALGVWLVVSSEKATTLRAAGLASFDAVARTLLEETVN